MRRALAAMTVMMLVLDGPAVHAGGYGGKCLESKGILVAEGYQDLVECTGRSEVVTSRPALTHWPSGRHSMSSSKRTTSIEFRSILGFPGYRVGTDGRVQSCWRRKGPPGGYIMSDQWKDLKPLKHRDGHRSVRLYNSNENRLIYVHRLVLEAFVGPPPFHGAMCRHLDGNPTNNSVGNLKWGTQNENMADAVRHGTACRGSRNRMAKLIEANIPEIRSLLAGGKLTQVEIGARFGVNSRVISAIYRGHAWKHVGV